MDTSLKDALKKAKRKQLLKIIITSIIVVVMLIPIMYKVGNYFAAKSSTKLHEHLFLHNAIAEPNVQIDSQVTSNSSMFGGNIVSNRSKNINGYVVRWNTLTSSYDWFRSNIDYNELIPGSYWSSSSKEAYNYDKQTKNKVATFYNPAIKEYHNGVKNELSAVSTMENYVAEVAISFNQPYTLKEIQTKIPDNLNIVWLYMVSPIKDESKGPAGMQVYGFDPEKEPEEAYKRFFDSLKQYDDNGYDEDIQKFLKANKNKPFDQVKILGVMLTGKTENFKVLENQDFVRGASVGVTAQVVPYIKPEK
ncbi:sigma factor regulator N-terminal domain-containing protein [Bacillus paranthracis]|uniref:sigma factor regulator N-terminal domain-containing protein n=1 Tax=Bacillus paranthracis TaxID=2026186 RepID=UPI002E1DF15D|nr:sigma factor regulator N-terminal domain-containing protein [Bacillus paranthracis]MED1681909.1 sigma factor regulator N-terminal domain-containing protein [Bacillus paranthracis]